MSEPLVVTKERVLAAAESCSDVECALKILFPEVFKQEESVPRRTSSSSPDSSSSSSAPSTRSTTRSGSTRWIFECAEKTLREINAVPRDAVAPTREEILCGALLAIRDWAAPRG